MPTNLLTGEHHMGEHLQDERPIGETYRVAGLVSLLILILVTSSSAGLNLRSDPRIGPEPASAWFFLRAGQALAPSESPVVLLAVGDLMLGRGMASKSPIFAQVASQIQSADLALGNFEGAIPIAGIATTDLPANSAYEPYRLLIPESAIDELRTAGFDILSVANNHALDGGEAGLAKTESKIRSAGMTALSPNPGQTSDSQLATRQIKGVTIAFLAFNRVSLPPLSISDPSQKEGEPLLSSSELEMDKSVESISAQIHLARTQADFVVVSVHWGREYQLQPDLSQKELAAAMLQAGADLVLGHHPHVVQETELVEREGKDNNSRTGFIAYSLGNFAFDQGWEETGQGLALRIYLDKQGLRAVQALPLSTSPRPHWIAPEEAKPLLERLSPPPPRLGFTCLEDNCQPVNVPQANSTGLFWSGQIDLTGDGVPEKIRRSGQTITIYQAGNQVWQSPPEWHVVDLDLGDANDDGRAELLLALNKQGPCGAEASHPFILGYRGGMYRLLWGGSSVQDPILEVELGDVNGDSVQELVTLEENKASGQRTLTVWRWHGWGFSQLWRSPSGFYQDLLIISGENKWISVSAPRNYSQRGLDQ